MSVCKPRLCAMCVTACLSSSAPSGASVAVQNGLGWSAVAGFLAQHAFFAPLQLHLEWGSGQSLLPARYECGERLLLQARIQPGKSPLAT